MNDHDVPLSADNDADVKQPGFPRSVRIGRTTDELVANGVWKGRGSAPSWVIGEGHLPIAEARAKALDAVAAAEELVNQKRAALDAAVKERTAAIRKAAAAQSALDDARLTLARGQMDLARRCGVLEVDADE